MNIKNYLKLMFSVWVMISCCCATFLDTIRQNHTDRQAVYNGSSLIGARDINDYTSENNGILRDEGKVSVNRPASSDEKRDIAIAVFGAAWADVTVTADGNLTPDAMIDSRSVRNPYTVGADGRVQVDNPALLNHFQILYWLDV